MSDNQTCDIDALLQETWLVVISLRHGPEFKEGDGQRLWQHCVDNIEQIQQQLTAANYSAESRQHILYAQCALLDEAAKSRGVHDDACIQWYNRPLQGQFFGNLNAGDHLYERIRQVLRETAPDIAVLTCFHRVLMLGFLGGFTGTHVPERERLVRELAERVPAYSFSLNHPVLTPASAGMGMGAWLRHWPVRIGLSVISLAALWWGLNHWLDNLIITLLPGGMR